jgi:myo-inositol-1(or 4)-monophosphatase
MTGEDVVMPDALLDIARRAALAAGELLLDRFGGPASGLESKSSRTDLVSDADRESEDLILGMLRRDRPDDAIVSEEGGGGEGTSGISWLVDPLDGTINYLWGLPQWSVTLGCSDAEGRLVGVVYDPGRGELFTAARGEGAFLNDRILRLEGAPPLDEALIGTGFSYRAEERVLQAERLLRVLPRVRDVRRLGSAALDLAWLAAGRLDGYYETALQLWDWAGGALVLEEAGGRVVETPPTGGFSAGLVAARAQLCDPLLSLVTGAE